MSCAAPSAGSLQVSPLPDRPGWRAIGEVNLLTLPAWERTLRHVSLCEEKVCHLELSAVTFVDVGGVSALAVAAQNLPTGNRIALHRPPTEVPRLLAMFWPDLPSIEVVTR